ncbi:MAG: hypothetical protein ABW223_06075 [Rariglobus sp.]
MPTTRSFRRHSGIVVALGALLLTACAQSDPYDAPQRTGSMPTHVRESSGLATSRYDSRLLWTHNDSGGQPVLYAIEPNGTKRGDLRITGIPHRDWEDLASFKLDGRSWLLIADTGDNGNKRTDCALYIVAEPEPGDLSPTTELTATVAWKIPVRYLDGPRDCEAVAVDARAGLVYLLAKRTAPHGLYTLPLRIPADGVIPAAMPVAQLPSALLPQPTASQRLLPIPTGRYRAQPTGMDFAPDGSAAVIVTYGDVLVFPRRKNEKWETALLRDPAVLVPHGLAQAEGVAFGADQKTIYVSSEGASSGIMRYQLAK